jgi:glucokinase
VSFERVASGSGIPNLYDFLLETGRHEAPGWLRDEIAAADDPTPAILSAGLDRRAPIATAVLDLFVATLGSVVGNVALSVMATGGLYLGGGLPPRMLGRLAEPDFHAAITAKGRFEAWLATLPVTVILDPKAALHGAAWHAVA